MTIPKGKKIILLSCPFISVSKPPYYNNQITPTGILKLSSLLKKYKNDVVYIDLYGKSPDFSSLQKNSTIFSWKYKNSSLEGKLKFKTYVVGYSSRFLISKLRQLKFKPDECWISTSFSWTYELVNEYIKALRKEFRDIFIRVGGDGIRDAYNEIKGKLYADYICNTRIVEADIMEPDYSIKDDWEYGVFSLQIGCANKCHFCTASKDKLMYFNIDRTIKQIKKFINKWKPKKIYNLDPNVLQTPHIFSKFIDEYINLEYAPPLEFVSGFEPDLILKHQDIFKKIPKGKIIHTIIPLEGTTAYVFKKFNKPYTIISTIKSLNFLKNTNFDLSRTHGNFVIGYPDDDITSIIRSFLICLKFGIRPTPFPVYLFPGTLDFKRYYKIISKKDISELHGELFPLIREKYVNDYISFLKFAKYFDNKEGKIKISILPDRFKKVFLKEYKNLDKFIEKCLNTKKDSIDELEKIEKSLA